MTDPAVLAPVIEDLRARYARCRHLEREGGGPALDIEIGQIAAVHGTLVRLFGKHTADDACLAAALALPDTAGARRVGPESP